MLSVLTRFADLMHDHCDLEFVGHFLGTLNRECIDFYTLLYDGDKEKLTTSEINPEQLIEEVE